MKQTALVVIAEGLSKTSQLDNINLTKGFIFPVDFLLTETSRVAISYENL